MIGRTRVAGWRQKAKALIAMRQAKSRAFRLRTPKNNAASSKTSPINSDRKPDQKIVCKTAGWSAKTSEAEKAAGNLSASRVFRRRTAAKTWSSKLIA